jgi:hypothetical protein
MAQRLRDWWTRRRREKASRTWRERESDDRIWEEERWPEGRWEADEVDDHEEGLWPAPWERD